MSNGDEAALERRPITDGPTRPWNPDKTARMTNFLATHPDADLPPVALCPNYSAQALTGSHRLQAYRQAGRQDCPYYVISYDTLLTAANNSDQDIDDIIDFSALEHELHYMGLPQHDSSL